MRILIVGGGTAGWMSAALMSNALREKAKITLIESEQIGIIGVGEGSTPKMRRLFKTLGLTESSWMPKCNATYKCGIRFPDWSTRKGFKSYYHPFFSASDDGSVRAFYQNATIRSKSFDVHAHPDSFFVSNFLAKNMRAPLPDQSSNYETDYAYHFDAVGIGQILKEYSISLGVSHIVDTVQEIFQKEDGEITGVHSENVGLTEADFFVDCTGFSSQLICKKLNVPFISYKSMLFNDRAVAMPTPLPSEEALPCQTISKAAGCGWIWNIPLKNRFGNGYVYSSDFLSETEAEEELRKHLGTLDSDTEARHLKMRVGRLSHCWEKNCLSVGLSQGFIEPLEATALMVVQDTVEIFLENFMRGGLSNTYSKQANEKVNLIFDGIKNYIVTHYKLNSRSDTAYWIENRENENISEELKAIINTWDKGGDLLGELKSQAATQVYSPTSWYCILAGMGRFPRNLKKPKKKFEVYDYRNSIQFCEQMMDLFPDHRTTIHNLPAIQ
ncbi:MAG: tryptophan halogenase family protein [Pseudomonadota bacterium]|nr:tryptophan halogenase family protein [Pseudomonadota bacterium]